jgi:ubiquinone/menaquinone biosynthesis C-methylase UbiE
MEAAMNERVILESAGAPRVPERGAREQFDRQAGEYGTGWNTLNEASLEWLVRHAACAAEHRVLDVATGAGFTALALAPRVREVIGIDISPEMLAQAEERACAAGTGNVRFQEAAAEALPFDDGSFDLVTCRIAPHHFLQVRRFVAEAARVLRPSGSLMIVDTTVPDGQPEVDAWHNEAEALRDPSHVRSYSPAEWREFLESAGLTVERLETLKEHRQPLSRWLARAGCTPEQARAVRDLFARAPAAATAAFGIEQANDGEFTFRWTRALIRSRRD